MNMNFAIPTLLLSSFLTSTCHAFTLDEAIDEGRRRVLGIEAAQKRIEMKLDELNKRLDGARVSVECPCKEKAEAVDE
jgi:hypothetical protein